MVSACLNLEIHLIIKYKLSGWWFQTYFIFHFIYGMSSFPLTHIFQRGRYTTNQLCLVDSHGPVGGPLSQEKTGVHCNGRSGTSDQQLMAKAGL